MSEAARAYDFGMTDLSETLRAEGGDRVRASIVARLAELEQDVSLALTSGLSPMDYASSQKLRAALVAAREIVVQFR